MADIRTTGVTTGMTIAIATVARLLISPMASATVDVAVNITTLDMNRTATMSATAKTTAIISSDKGALIGGAGGAVLGAIFGRGLKGTIIGGAAGAGIGAAVGEANQNNRRRDDYNRRGPGS